VALEYAIVKDHVDETVGVADQDPLLARFEAEAVSELEQKLFELVEQRCFEIGLGHDVLGLDAENSKTYGPRMSSAGAARSAVVRTSSASLLGSLERPERWKYSAPI
jgi:hypothetical protein